MYGFVVLICVGLVGSGAWIADTNNCEYIVYSCGFAIVISVGWFFINGMDHEKGGSRGYQIQKFVMIVTNIMAIGIIWINPVYELSNWLD